MGRFQGIGLAATVMLAWLAASSPAAAQAQATSPATTPDELRLEVADLRLKLLEAESEADEIEAEKRLLDAAPRGGNAAGPLSAEIDFWKKVLPQAVPGQGADGSPAALVKAEDQDAIDKDRKDAVNAWKKAQVRALAFQAEKAKTEELMGGPPGIRGLGGGISPDLIAFGVLAVLGGLILTAHEIRHRLRWRLRAWAAGPA